jgi:hypothetical protein
MPPKDFFDDFEEDVGAADKVSAAGTPGDPPCSILFCNAPHHVTWHTNRRRCLMKMTLLPSSSFWSMTQV